MKNFHCKIRYNFSIKKGDIFPVFKNFTRNPYFLTKKHKKSEPAAEPVVNTAPVDDTVMFHRELRLLYEEYSKEMDELRKEKNKSYRGI